MPDKLDGGHLLVVDAHHALANLQVLLVHLLLELVEVGHGARLEVGSDTVQAGVGSSAVTDR